VVVPRRERRLAEKSTSALTLAAARLPAVREHLLRLAGRGQGQIVAEIRAALDTLVDELTAQKVQRLVLRSSEGDEHVETFVDIDSPSRIRAATELLSAYGIYSSKNAGGSAPIAAAKVEITLRSATEPDRVTVVEVPAAPSD